MNSWDGGFETARLDLYCGCPGYHYGPRDGEYIFGIDVRDGLPMGAGGDDGPDFDWIGGYNQSVLAYAEKHEFRWISRLPWISELQNIC